MIGSSEHHEQREFVKWFRQTWPHVRILAIPNGGARGIAAAARLKAEGASAGVPDMFIPEWRVWVEMKKQGGKVSTDQADWMGYLSLVGYICIVTQGFADAREQILKISMQERQTND